VRGRSIDILSSWRFALRISQFPICALLCLLVSVAAAQQPYGTLVVTVWTNDRPVAQAEVVAAGQEATSNDHGEATLQLLPGEVEVVIQRFGFSSRTIRAVVIPETVTRVKVELRPEGLEEEIIIMATRSEKRIEDEPLRVEVVDREEIEEKALMTPGDIAMLLNETSGLRVQVTSPSLGAASVRIQGLRGPRIFSTARISITMAGRIWPAIAGLWSGRACSGMTAPDARCF
jgi:iron complex outermembrane receptor protein